jgi:hypothetical protein
MAAMISQTLQGAALSITSNVLAQVITSYKDNKPFVLNPIPVLKFCLYSIISNPPNIIWQTFLEKSYPTHVEPSKSDKEKPKASDTPKKTTSAKNVLIKFLLDQSFGAVMNTVMFLTYIGYMNASSNGKFSSWDAATAEVRTKFWPLLFDGMKVWPIFSLVSFLWIPVERRIVAGCAVGVLWGIYLSLMVGS